MSDMFGSHIVSHDTAHFFFLDQVEQYQGSRTIDDLTTFVTKMVAKEPSGDKLGTDGKVPEPEKKTEEVQVYS